MKRYPIQELTADAFRPFGSILEKAQHVGEICPPTHEWYGNLATVCDQDQVSVNILVLCERPFVCQKLECHEKTTENIIPLGGKGFYAALAPAGPLDPAEICVFFVPGDKGISLAPGVWHYVPHPVRETSEAIVVFRKDTGKDDMHFADLPDPIEFVPYLREQEA